MGIKVGGHIEKVNGKELSYSEFVERYLVKNQPVVLTGLMDDWRACKDWVSHDGQPNLQFFSTHFGKSKVQVADCGTREFMDQKTLQMSVSDFVGHWLEGRLQECSNASKEEDNGRSVLYLKDWHFVKEYPAYLAYTTPLFFRDDWLNMYLENYSMHSDPDAYEENNEISCSDYRFVYMGAKGSWTPLHADVFRSFSWSANVCGKKQWHFLPPSQCHLVFDRNLKSCVYNIFGDVSETKFPDFKKAIWLECTQEENEIIFVPSGWYHQVHNLEDTISINHNWFNAYNLSWVWDLLLRDYNEARGYIEDIRDICDDFEGLCQRNLAANTGMNFYDFFIFVTRLSFANLTQLSNLLRDNGSSVWISLPIARHLALNFGSIKKIALKMRWMEGLAGNHGFLDWRESMDDPDFLELCTVLGRTYRTIHKQQNWGCDVKRTFMDNLSVFDFVKTHGSQICSPDDLIKLIDNGVAKLSGICDEEDILLSRWDDAQLLCDN